MMLAMSGFVREVADAFGLIAGLCTIMLIAITLAMVLFVVKYHRSRRRVTSQIHGHGVLEATWIIVPTAIFIWMFYVGYVGFAAMRKLPENAQVIRVFARQWSWTFEYPGAGVRSDKLFVPVGVPIRLEMTSAVDDVIHSLYIPDFRVKEDVLPGRLSHLWFNTERTGRHNIFCAEFCGTGHSKMLSELVVVEAKEFERWLTERRAEANAPLELPGVLDRGHAMYKKIDGAALFTAYCTGCHGAKGDGSALPGARNFTQAQGWKRSARLVDIYRTLTEGIAGTQMRPFTNLTPWQRFALAHQVRTFVPAPAPKDTPEDLAALTKEYKLDEQPPAVEPIPIEAAMKALVKEAAQDHK